MPLLTHYLYSVVTLPRFEPHQDCKLGLDRPLVKLTNAQCGGALRELTVDVFGLSKLIPQPSFVLPKY